MNERRPQYHENSASNLYHFQYEVCSIGVVGSCTDFICLHGKSNPTLAAQSRKLRYVIKHNVAISKIDHIEKYDCQIDLLTAFTVNAWGAL